MNSKEQNMETMTISLKLGDAAKAGLLYEVVTSAFDALRENPQLSDLEALSAGLREWDV